MLVNYMSVIVHDTLLTKYSKYVMFCSNYNYASSALL